MNLSKHLLILTLAITSSTHAMDKIKALSDAKRAYALVAVRNFSENYFYLAQPGRAFIDSAPARAGNVIQYAVELRALGITPCIPYPSQDQLRPGCGGTFPNDALLRSDEYADSVYVTDALALAKSVLNRSQLVQD